MSWPPVAQWDAAPGDARLRTIATRVEGIEAAAMRDCFVAVEGSGLGAAVASFAGATALRMSSIPSGMFCKVLGLGLVQPATLADVEGILAWYRDEGVRTMWFQPSPAAEPGGLVDLLAEAGIRPVARRWGKFVRGAEPAPRVSSSVEIREVGPDAADDFARTCLRGFAMPDVLLPWVAALPGRSGWRCYVGYEGDQPAACGAVFAQGELAFVGFGATLPEFRGRGAQQAMLARRVADAIDSGVELIATETGFDEAGPGPSWRNIERCGFRLLYLRPNCAADE